MKSQLLATTMKTWTSRGVPRHQTHIGDGGRVGMDMKATEGEADWVLVRVVLLGGYRTALEEWGA